MRVEGGRGGGVGPQLCYEWEPHCGSLSRYIRILIGTFLVDSRSQFKRGKVLLHFWQTIHNSFTKYSLNHFTSLFGYLAWLATSASASISTLTCNLQLELRLDCLFGVANVVWLTTC